MIQVYRALHGISNIDWMKLVTMAPSNTTRGHSLKHVENSAGHRKDYIHFL